MRICALLAVLAAVATGCTSQAEKKMGGGEVDAAWPARDNLESGPLFEVGYPGEMGDWNGVKRGAVSENFVTAVQEFEQAPIPEEHADKKAAKDAAVAALKDLIETAKSKPASEVKTKYEAAMAAVKALH